MRENNIQKTSIGQRIQSFREQKKLSLVQLAREAGITRTTLAEIEKGAANPGMDSIIRICDALSISMSGLFLQDQPVCHPKVIMQPINGSLFDPLSASLREGTYSTFQLLVAYAKSSGVDLITSSVSTFRKNGGIVEAYVGIDQKNTTADALFKLFKLCDALYVVHDRAFAQTYHPKLYLLSNEAQAWLAVGSNNLTRGGLFTNYESTVIQIINRADCNGAEVHNSVVNSLQNLKEQALARRINSVDDILFLLHEGLIMTEQESRMGVRKSSITNTSGFGHRSIAPIPEPEERILVPLGIFDQGERKAAKASVTKTSKNNEESGDSLVTAKALITVNRSPDLQGTCWFFAGKLTGGSRNILDLSENARLQHGVNADAVDGKIPGGVAFFGVDPENHNIQKDITVLYNGIKYYPSTIKYAPGNSNWRVQLKGEAETGGKALSQFGEDFVEHVLVFHKLTDDCYILETMLSDEINELKKNSRFWATNGRSNTGRPFGML